MPAPALAFLAATRERAEAFERAAVPDEAEEPFRALLGVCFVAEVFDLGGALLLTLPVNPYPIEVRRFLESFGPATAAGSAPATVGAPEPLAP